MPRTYTYDNNFDNTDGDGDNLDGATLTTIGTGVGGTNSPLSAGSDNELVFVSVQGTPTNAATYEGALLSTDPNLTGNEYVSSFTASMRLDMSEIGDSVLGPSGNYQPDGMSFSYGDLGTYRPNVIPTGGRLDYEQGVSEGLSVRIIPYSGSATGRGSMQITWNGNVIGTTNFTGSGSRDSLSVRQVESDFNISVSDTGSVSASFGSFTVSGTIPGNQWATADQSGWDFGIGGRSGSAGGTIYVDDAQINATITFCFARGTMIGTPAGPIAVERLRCGDEVVTRDSGAQQIRWIGARSLESEELRQNPNLRPIRIGANSLGPAMPQTDLVVSPQHRILVSSSIAQRMFGTAEVLVAAKQLLALEGVEVVEDEDWEQVEYFHFLFERHEIVRSNGAWTESLFTGPEALKAVGPAARREIAMLFPEIVARDFKPRPARPLVKGRQGRKMAERHASNRKPIMC
jgi:hypothetical protein